MPVYIEIQYSEHVPISKNKAVLQFTDLIQKLNEIAEKHQIVRIDHVENRLAGIKSRQNQECPKAVTLLTAQKDIDYLTLIR